MFIAGGAFPNLKEVQEKEKVMGFGASNIEEDKKHSHGEMQVLLEKFGMIPEFYGRFPSIVELEDLDVNALERIIKEPKNSIKNLYTNLLKSYNIDVNFTPSFIKAVAEQAKQIKTGARGLKTIMEDKLSEVMYNAHKYEYKSITLGISKGEVQVRINKNK